MSGALAVAARQIGEFLASVEPFFWRAPITYVDVGAHKGDVFRELMRSGLRIGEAHLVEPNPASFAALGQIVQELGMADRVACHPLALGERPGRLRFRDADDMTQVIGPAEPGDPAPGVFEVEVATLDTLAASFAASKISLLKIDVEGYEREVLAGAQGLLAGQAIDMVYIEAGMNPEGRQQTYFRVVEDALNAHGYRLFRVFEQKNEWPEDSPLLRRVNAAFMSPRFAAANPYGLSVNLLRFSRENERLKQALTEQQTAAKARDEQQTAAMEAEKARGQTLRQAFEAELRRALELGLEFEAERNRLQALEEELAPLKRKVRKLAADHMAGKTELKRLRHEHARVLASTSWRVTAPLRAVGDAMKGRRRLPRPRLPRLPRAVTDNRSVAQLARWIDRRRCERLLRRSPLFDPGWYLAEYPGVADAGVDPLSHFLAKGRLEGRNPSAAFDTVDYMKRYPDVARSGLNPLVHYLRRGRSEGREIHPAAPGPHAERCDFDPAAAAAWTAVLRAHPARAELANGPLVSIVLPTRDRIRLLPAAIDSILAQSYRRWELIVVDDGSTDGTAETLHERFRDPRIRVIGTPGLGVSGARNAGLAAAAGELVAYLDSDNSWMPDYLELMVAEFARSGAASVYAVLKVREDKGIWYRAVPFDYARLRFSNYIDLNIFMHRMELYRRHGGFDTGLRRAVDWDLILRYVKADPVSFAYFVGAEYDHSSRKDRLTVRELYAFKNVVRNKHWIDWEAEAVRLAGRDPELVSVVMVVQRPLERSEDRLSALFTHPAGCAFELVLVDNGCDAVSKAILSDWCRREPAIRVVEAGENVQLALGSNLGLAASSGAVVVFLGEEVEVGPEWLRPLVRPLQDPAVKGVQPKVLAPDGRIDSAGLAFAAASPFAYPLYAGLPGDFEPTSRPRDVAAISGACAAFRAADLVAVRGFHPIYTTEQQDVDLCLRLGGGEASFRYVPDAVVRRHPGPRVRDTRIEADRRQFRERWSVPPDDTAHYARDGLPVPQYLPDRPAWVEAGLAAWQPGRPAAVPHARPGPDATALAGRTVALKIGCPRPEVKDNWGDYHFAAALAAALLRKGVRARIDFAADPDRHAAPSDINLVLRGRQRFEPRPDALNLIWLISHPDRPNLEELRGFDHVFVASEVWARQLTRDSGLACQTLLQCTDSARFYPMPPDPALASPALFVANSRNVLRSVVREAIEQDLAIDIYGEMWEEIAPAGWIRAPKIDNVDLPRYYASADAVLNDHWDSMRANGFISNRIFDVLACAAPLVTDRIAGLPDEIATCCHVFDADVPLRDAIAVARRHGVERRDEALRVAELVRRDHSFDARAETIIAVIQAKLAGNRTARRLAG